VVGQRVVVRRVLPGETGPTGGPALTDVLGVCESWADGVVVVRREDGTTIHIRTADIVSGKPVPPRPSVRLRVSSREAEDHAAPLWPGVLREPLGDWQLRLDPAPVGRPLKRTNSCLAMGDPAQTTREALARVEAFYRQHDRDALVQVEAGSEAEDTALAEGWTPVAGGDAVLLIGSLARARRLLGRPGADVEVRSEVDGPRLLATARLDGELGDGPVGSLRAGLDRDWLGLHGLAVGAAYRRRGVATALVTAAARFGAEHGATTLWLHVETDNDAAIALYGSLGLTAHHECRYLAAP
jgi:ribosomal protein S18 acetylase RimI-like enzyme